MAEQIMKEVITKAEAETTRIVIQPMAKTQTQRITNASGPKLGASWSCIKTTKL